MSKVTIREIAQRCGLSVATVSRVLGNSSYPVRQETKMIVLKTAQEMGYAPATPMRWQKVHGSEIAVVVPTVQNSFCTSVVKGIEMELLGSGYNILLFTTDTQGRSTLQLVDGLPGRSVEGVVIAADSLDHRTVEKLVQMRRELNFPVVVVGSPSTISRLPSVNFDYYKGARMAAEYLIAKGHTRIAYAASLLDRATRRARLEGFQSAFTVEGRAEYVHDSFEYYTESEFESGIEIATQILQSGNQYTAVAAINDLVAAGLLSSFTRQKVRVPQDISLIGYDDSLYAPICGPPLTTVRVPAKHMGSQAARQLVREITGAAVSLSVYSEPEIVERCSVVGLPPKW